MGSNFIRKYRIPLVVLVLLALAAGGVYLAYQLSPRPETGGQTIPVSGGAVTTSGGESMSHAGEEGLSLQLSPGKPEPQVITPLPLATGEPLPEAEVERILARLPALTDGTQDQVDFRLAQEPIPPPRTGETIQQAFPPPQQAIQPGTDVSAPLEVLRYAPQGEIPIAPFVSVTFNQPMVPLSTLEALAEKDVPVIIEPALPGVWRWMGTKTLTFEYDSELIDRLPKATEYRVTIPAGTRSLSGSALAEAVTWTFSTPPPVVTSTYPYDQPQPLEPLFFIAFDQRIDPAAVLDTVRVRAGEQIASLKLAEEADIQADLKVKNLVKNTPEGRWLAFRALEPLPADTHISVTIGPGTPSAEGPLVTSQAHSYNFRTYAPLRIVEHRCAWSDVECPPLTPFYIRFNNPIDSQVYKEAMLRIEPELPGASVSIFGDTINIQGATRGRTTYTVTVSGKIQDIFGQELGSDTRLEFKVGPAEPFLFRQEQILVTLDPAAKKPVFSVYAVNYPRLEVKIYAVQPNDWPAFKRYMQEFYRTDITPQIPGRLVLDRSLPVEAPADALTEVGIDLSQVMDGRFGHFIVVVQPPSGALKNEQDRFYQTVHAWVQVTQIGLDAFVDHSEMVVWASALGNGAPLSGVKVEALPGGMNVVTGKNGTVRFAIPDGASFLVASQGDRKSTRLNSSH